MPTAQTLKEAMTVPAMMIFLAMDFSVRVSLKLTIIPLAF